MEEEAARSQEDRWVLVGHLGVPRWVKTPTTGPGGRATAPAYLLTG
jgi:hypothetical protein